MQACSKSGDTFVTYAKNSTNPLRIYKRTSAALEWHVIPLSPDIEERERVIALSANGSTLITCVRPPDGALAADSFLKFYTYDGTAFRKTHDTTPSSLRNTKSASCNADGSLIVTGSVTPNPLKIYTNTSGVVDFKGIIPSSSGLSPSMSADGSTIASNTAVYKGNLSGYRPVLTLPTTSPGNYCLNYNGSIFAIITPDNRSIVYIYKTDPEHPEKGHYVPRMEIIDEAPLLLDESGFTFVTNSGDGRIRAYIPAVQETDITGEDQRALLKALAQEIVGRKTIPGKTIVIELDSAQSKVWQTLPSSLRKLLHDKNPGFLVVPEYPETISLIQSLQKIITTYKPILTNFKDLKKGQVKLSKQIEAFFNTLELFLKKARVPKASEDTLRTLLNNHGIDEELLLKSSKDIATKWEAFKKEFAKILAGQRRGTKVVKIS